MNTSTRNSSANCATATNRARSSVLHIWVNILTMGSFTLSGNVRCASPGGRSIQCYLTTGVCVIMPCANEGSGQGQIDRGQSMLRVAWHRFRPSCPWQLNDRRYTEAIWEARAPWNNWWQITNVDTREETQTWWYLLNRWKMTPTGGPTIQEQNTSGYQ